MTKELIEVEIEGRKGVAVLMDEDSGMYEITFEDGSRLLLLPAPKPGGP